MKVKKWMAQLQINKLNNRKCKSLRHLTYLQQRLLWCNRLQVQHLHQRRLNLKRIGLKCWHNRNETWTQSDNGKWRKKKWESYNWSTSNKKLKKLRNPLLQLLRPRGKNKWINRNNRKLLHNIKILKDVRNHRATTWILHRNEERKETMTTSIYPSTAQVWIEQNRSQPWQSPQ